MIEHAETLKAAAARPSFYAFLFVFAARLEQAAALFAAAFSRVLFVCALDGLNRTRASCILF